MSIPERALRLMQAMTALIDHPATPEHEREASKAKLAKMIEKYGNPGPKAAAPKAAPRPFRDWASHTRQRSHMPGKGVSIYDDPAMRAAIEKASIWLWNSGFFVKGGNPFYDVARDYDINEIVARSLTGGELLEFAVEKGMGVEALGDMANKLGMRREAGAVAL